MGPLRSFVVLSLACLLVGCSAAGGSPSVDGGANAEGGIGGGSPDAGDGGRSDGGKEVDGGSPSTDAGGDACKKTSCAAEGKDCGQIGDGCGGTLDCGTCASGTTCGASEANVCSCTKTTCAAASATCGSVPDGCGGTLSCGACTAPATCGGGGTSDACGCTPTSCTAAGATCGTMPDGCGGTLSCGSCSGAGETCGGGGTANVCGQGPCTPVTCGSACGTISDGCGGTLSCPGCTSPATCGGGGTANRCGCTPTTCAAAGADCGSIPDGCGGTLACGSCNAPQTCGGGSGGANTCGCTPETDAAFCAAANATCGSVTGNDNCGTSRTVASCGTCTAPATCGGGGSANQCGAYTEPMNPICSPGGWCWDNPRPQGNALTAVSTSPSGTEWVAGHAGTVLTWNGTTWNGWTAVSPADFYAVWATTDADVWLAGDAGTLVHYDGTTFTSASSPETKRILGLWGASSSAVWAIAENGDVLFWNGTSWALSTSLGEVVPEAITGTSATSVFVVGNGFAARYDGTSWKTVTESGTFTGVWAASSTNVWAIGGTALLRWDGVSWSSATGANGWCIYGNSANDIWVGGTVSTGAWHWNGLAWTQVPVDPAATGEGITALGGDGSGKVLGAGTDGILYRYVNGAWNRVWTGTTPNAPAHVGLEQAVVVSPTVMYGAGQGYTAQNETSFDGLVFERLSTGAGVASTDLNVDSFFVLAASSANDVWAGGRTDLDHWNGSSWTVTTAPDGITDVLGAVDFSPTDAWIAGDDKTEHWDGTKWTSVANPLSGTSVYLAAMGGIAGGDVWVGSTAGDVLRYTGGAWAAVTVPGTGQVTSFTEPQAGFALACQGTDGMIEWNGSTWTATGPAGSCGQVWAGSPTNAWAVVYDATLATSEIYRYQGASWTQVDPGLINDTGVAGIAGTSGPTWIVGGGGQTLYHD